MQVTYENPHVFHFLRLRRYKMFIDKTETYQLNMAHLNKRATRKRLSKLCKQIEFCDPVQAAIRNINNIYVLEITIPKRELPYIISFLSFHNYTIYQILDTTRNNTIIDPEQLSQSSKHFSIRIDGLNDLFIKDKIIDIVNMIEHREELNYIFHKNRMDVTCTPSTFATLIRCLATHHIDILAAYHCCSVLSKAHIS